MTNKEKFLELVSSEGTRTLSKAKARKQNRRFSRLSHQIALAILERLDTLDWSQKQLADTMGVSPQQVNKWVKGGENFTMETLVKLEQAMDFKFEVRVAEKSLPEIKVTPEFIWEELYNHFMKHFRYNDELWLNKSYKTSTVQEEISNMEEIDYSAVDPESGNKLRRVA